MIPDYTDKDLTHNLFLYTTHLCLMFLGTKLFASVCQAKHRNIKIFYYWNSSVFWYKFLGYNKIAGLFTIWYICQLTKRMSNTLTYCHKSDKYDDVSLLELAFSQDHLFSCWRKIICIITSKLPYVHRIRNFLCISSSII